MAFCDGMGGISTGRVARLVAAVLFASFFYSCGGPCCYVDVPGEATIVAVEDVVDDQPSCPNDPVRVIFDFEPDDSGDRVEADNGRRLLLPGDLNPPRQWVIDEGISEGSVQSAVRQDVTNGGCESFKIDFTDVDYSAGEELCTAP